MTLRPISKTDEDIEDVVAALLAAGNGLDVTYDDENGTLTVDVSQNAIGTGELSFETATQDELDAVESSAADARTDLRFALYPEEVDASTRDSYYQNFAKFADSAAMTSIAASSVVMDEVSESETAMDAVSVSDTALDAIWQSQTAWDIVKAKSMAVGKFAAGRAGLNGADYAGVDAVASSQTAMDAVSTSSTAMDAVSTSSTAMDAVSASQTARDAIGTDGVGYDAVAAVAMAIGKYAAGIAGLDPTAYADIDAVASDANAMDAVSASSLAVQSVTGSALALWRFLSSAEVNTSFWSNATGTEAFWDHNGDLADPHWQLDADSRHGGKALFLDCDQFPSGGDYIPWTVDLGSASSLTVYEKTLNLRGVNFEIIVNGTVEYSASNDNFSYTGRTVDVSSYGDGATLKVGLASSDSSGRETLVSDIQLS